MMSRTTPMYPGKHQHNVGFSKNTTRTRILPRGGMRRRFKGEEGERGRGERRVLLLRTTTTTSSSSSKSSKGGALREDKEEEGKPLLSGTAIKRIAGEDVSNDVGTEQ